MAMAMAMGMAMAMACSKTCHAASELLPVWWGFGGFWVVFFSWCTARVKIASRILSRPTTRCPSRPHFFSCHMTRPRNAADSIVLFLQQMVGQRTQSPLQGNSAAHTSIALRVCFTSKVKHAIKYPRRSHTSVCYVSLHRIRVVREICEAIWCIDKTTRDSTQHGHLGTWAAGRLGIWTSGHLDIWAAGQQGTWAPGHLGTWESGHLGT